MNNILTLIEDISKKLNDSSNQKAWWLVEAITKQNKSQLLINKNFKLNSQEQDLLDLWINQYVNNHKPLQYIIGEIPFLNLNILVEPPTLIPRPETEFWCDQLVKKLNLLSNKKIKILDIGTGSGCIAISLAKNFPQADIYAVDIADHALTLAQKNIEYNKVKNIKLSKSDLFENLIDYKFDLIISNPPYIDEDLFQTLDPSVKNWEDSKALICKNNGLDLIKKIISESQHFLNVNDEFREKNIPQLMIEIDCTQGEIVKHYLKENNFYNIKLDKDCFQKDRVVSARR